MPDSVDRPHHPPDAATSQIESVYQPIVDLRSRDVVGFEALSRWPAAPTLTPDLVFADARRSGDLAALDRAAQLAAMRGAHRAGLSPNHSLFINVEVDTRPDESLARAVGTAGVWSHRIVIELTERALLVDPARVIEITDAARESGLGIALDDVGSSPDSLAMLEFVEPDIIKIDGRLIRSGSLSPSHCATIDTVAAYVEAAPMTTVVAEGIEVDAHLERACAIGATHGQGWMLGRPGPIPANLPDLAEPGIEIVSHSRLADRPPLTPAAVLDRGPARAARASLLNALTRHLEDTAATLGEPFTLLASFQDARNFTPTVAARYSALAAANPHSFVAALAVGLPAHPATHVRGTAIGAEEDFASEWAVTVVGPNYFGALIARDLGDPITDPDRRYAYTLTHDRTIVTDAARSLMRRIQRAH